MFKNIPFIPLGILACLILFAGSGMWALRLMDSLFSYRSPLRINPPAPGQVVAQPVTQRLIIILVDALREDTSQDAEVMPFLNQLRQQGSWAVMHSHPPSYSEPGYSVLLTGAWPDLSDGPAANLDYEDIYPFTQDNLFSAAHRVGIRTAVSGYYWFEKLIPVEAVNAGFFTPGEDQLADRQVVDAAIPWLDSGEYGLVLIHLDQVDYAGHHEGGPRHPNWAQAANRSDALIAEITSHLDLSQDVVMIVSDHGQVDAGGHGGHEPIVLLEPFIMTGARVRQGQYEDIQMVDVAPTAALLLGINLPASSQGKPLAEMLSLDDEQLQALQSAYKDQQTELVEAYTAAIGQPSPTINLGTLSLAEVHQAYEKSLKAAQLARLRTERLLRAALSLPIGVIVILLLIKIPKPRLWWLLVSAMVYVLLFNLRYVWLDGKTYSLSSITSPTDIILYVGGTSGLALLAAWIVSISGLGGFRSRKFSSTARLAIELALVITAFLAIPVLWSFVENGPLINWILPDFISSFAAFFSLLQILFVSLVAILLSGLSMLFDLLVIRRSRPMQPIYPPG